MHTFPDITLAGPDYWLWLWAIIPAALALVFLVAERFIEKFTETKFGHPVVGIGYVLMGICLLIVTMSISVVPDVLDADANAQAVAALENIGFQDVRFSTDTGAFGGYYEGTLIRAVIYEDMAHRGTYSVIQTPPPTS